LLIKEVFKHEIDEEVDVRSCDPQFKSLVYYQIKNIVNLMREYNPLGEPHLIDNHKTSIFDLFDDLY
jgi:hypothetical protein